MNKKDQSKDALLPKKKTAPVDDDTVTDGNESESNPAVAARRGGRGTRRQYRAFIKENKSFWMWFNLIIVFVCIGFGIGTYFVLQVEEAKCGVLNMTLYILICFHLVNLFAALFNLCGLEKKICNTTLVCILVIFEFAVLACMQFIYFDAMKQSCHYNAPY